jgi:hypothetical protein
VNIGWREIIGLLLVGILLGFVFGIVVGTKAMIVDMKGCRTAFDQCNALTNNLLSKSIPGSIPTVNYNLSWYNRSGE